MPLTARRIVTSVFVLAIAAAAQAQPPAAPAGDGATSQAPPAAPDSWFARVAVAPARVVAASDFQSGGDGARSVAIEAGRQTNGAADWHRVYNYPSYGIGVYATRFDHDRELGNPVAVYGFFSWPFPIASRVQISADVGMGVAWNWNAFDAATNPTNTALGSSAAYQINGGVLLHYLAADHTSFYGGLNVTHWSNGATKQPNLGLAVIGPQAGVRYDFAPRQLHRRARPSDLPPFLPSWEFVVGAGGSSKNVVAAGTGTTADGDRRRSFGALNVTTAMQRHVYRFGRVAAGGDLTYDGSAGARVDVIGGREIESRAPADRRLSFGAYGGYEHVMARFSVLLHVGYTIWRGVDDPEVPRLYQRYGARFQLSDHFWTTFAVRAVKGRKASFMELGLGYRVRLPDRVG